jgi:hypothetical protein
MRNLRTLALLGALSVAGLSAAASANTIQPIFMSASNNGNGTYTYTYDLQLTPNNGLSNNALYQSAVIILDFGHITGTPVVSNLGGLAGANVTSAGSWGVEKAVFGGGTLQNVDYIPTDTYLKGASKSVQAPDLGGDNVIVYYTNATALAPVAMLQRSLIQLTLTTDLAPGGGFLDSLSRNTIVGKIDELGTHAVSTGPALVPLPAAVWAGMSMLGSLGLVGAMRRRRQA